MRDRIGDRVNTAELESQWLIIIDLAIALIAQILAVCGELPAAVSSREAETEIEQSVSALYGLRVQVGIGADVLLPDVGIFRAQEPLEVARPDWSTPLRNQ